MKTALMAVILAVVALPARAGIYYNLAQNASSATLAVGGNITLGAATTGTQKITFDGLTGSVTASAFFGNGAGITGLAGNSAFAAKASSGTNADISTLAGVAGAAVTVSTSLSVAAFNGNVTIGAMNSGGAICVNGSPTTATCQGMAESNTGDANTYIMSPGPIVFDFAGAPQDTFSADGSVVFKSTLTVQTGSILASASSVTASAFFGDGSHLSNTSLPVTVTSSLTFSGATAFLKSNSSVTASAFFGNGQNLSGVVPTNYTIVAGDLNGLITAPSLNFTQQAIGVLSSLVGITIPGAGSTGNYSLSVNGAMIAGSTSATRGFVDATGNNKAYNYMPSNALWGIRTAGDNSYNLDVYNSNNPLTPLTVAQTGKVGVSTSSPQSTLDVNGSAQFGASGSVSTFNVVGALFMRSGSSITLAGSGGSITSVSSITAGAFYGDASHLSGVSAAFNGGTVSGQTTFQSSVTVQSSATFQGQVHISSGFVVNFSPTLGFTTTASNLGLAVTGSSGSFTVQLTSVTCSLTGSVSNSGTTVNMYASACIDGSCLVVPNESLIGGFVTAWAPQVATAPVPITFVQTIQVTPGVHKVYLSIATGGNTTTFPAASASSTAQFKCEEDIFQ